MRLQILRFQILYLLPNDSNHTGAPSDLAELLILKSETSIPSSNEFRALTKCHHFIIHQGSFAKRKNPQAVGRIKMHLVLTVTVEPGDDRAAPKSHSFLQHNSLLNGCPY